MQIQGNEQGGAFQRIYNQTESNIRICDPNKSIPPCRPQQVVRQSINKEKEGFYGLKIIIFKRPRIENARERAGGRTREGRNGKTKGTEENENPVRMPKKHLLEKAHRQNPKLQS